MDAVLDAVDTVGVVSGGSTLQMVQVNKLSIKAETRESSAFSMHFTIKESRSQYFSGFPCVQKSSNPAHRAIWARISASPRSLVDNYVAGLELVEVVLQKVPSEANPKGRNHGEGPY